MVLALHARVFNYDASQWEREEGENEMEYLVSSLTSHESKPSEIALGSLGLSASTIHSDCPWAV